MIGLDRSDQLTRQPTRLKQTNSPGLLPEVAQVPYGLILQLRAEQRVGLGQNGDEPTGWRERGGGVSLLADLDTAMFLLLVAGKRRTRDITL